MKKRQEWPTPLFVKVENIRTGDVLLTFGNGAKSRLGMLFSTSTLIAFFTRGRYSHAAIFVNQGDIFESYRNLVGPVRLETGHATFSGKRHRVVRIPHNPTLAEIWRHRKNLAHHEWDEAIPQIMKEDFGTNYSLLARMVNLSTRIGWARPVAITIARLLDRRGRSPVPGTFCSELVAKFYAKRNLPLFESTMLPEAVTPEALSHSLLEIVPDVIIPMSELIDYQLEAPESVIAEETRQMNFFRVIEIEARRQNSELKRLSGDSR